MTICEREAASAEQWLPVTGEETSYEVSNLGRVRSIERYVEDEFRGKIRVRCFKGVMLKPRPDKSRHLRVTLSGQRERYIHVLVLEAFVGPCPPREECRHLDGDPDNNALDNLCWGTRSRNTIDRKYHKITGKHQSKLSPDDVRWIRASVGAVYGTELAKEFGVSNNAISQVRNFKIHADVE